jgi:transcriptional regulator with XRE-family HTH domain
MNATSLIQPNADPSALRKVLSDNLRKLMGSRPNVSDDCRKMGLNRTQFNRYLSGESYPRPEVLAKICAYYQTDANILLWPVGEPVPGEPEERSFLRACVTDNTLNLTVDFETLRDFVRMFRGESIAFAAIQKCVDAKPDWLGPDQLNELELNAFLGPRPTLPTPETSDDQKQ